MLGPVVVVVLGDWGRSPRMQYHALSLAASRHVHVVSYAGREPCAAVFGHERITLHVLSPPPRWLARLPRALSLLVKALLQLAVLVWALLVRCPRPSAILMQTPPCAPTFVACQLLASVRRCRLVCDWHNFGYSLLELTSAPRGLVRLAERYEKAFGRRADAHMCVTHAMAAVLATPPWGIRSVAVMHDRPAASLRRGGPADAHLLLGRISPLLASSPAAAPRDWAVSALVASSASRTLATEMRDGVAALRPDRPALIVSSTSWTVDEDVASLLPALQLYETAWARPSSMLPRLLVVVTGDGPMRGAFEAAAARLQLRSSSVRTAWLAMDDYRALLGTADAGISFHTSSSGLDLPMKIVDFFGAGLPVAARDFSCVAELVRDDQNGLLFDDAEGLALALGKMLHSFDGAQWRATPTLARLAAGAEAWAAVRWDDAWAVIAAPIFNRWK